jgi:hypothetical protein
MKAWHWAALAGVLGCSGPAAAQGFAIGAQIGTTGIGGELQYELFPTLVARGAVDYLSYDRDLNYESVDYSGQMKFTTGGAFLDWHPLLGSFFVSGGLYFGKRQVSLTATPAATITIDNVVFTAAQAGSVTGSIKMSSTQPFLGLGFDNSFQGLPGLGFKFLLGVAFSGSPSVSLNSAGGLLSNDATFQARLAAERDKIKDDAKEFKYFPVLNAGLTFRY